MARADAIKVEGVILEVTSDRTCRVELANGHRVLAFVTGKAKPSFARFSPGDRVTLEMSPCDLSEGRIVVEPEKNLEL